MILFKLKNIIAFGLKSLWMHKMRSALTTLGIIFGVASVIAMLAIGEGAKRVVMRGAGIKRSYSGGRQLRPGRRPT